MKIKITQFPGDSILNTTELFFVYHIDIRSLEALQGHCLIFTHNIY